MPAVRFTIQVLGETLHGVAFQTETELDALLACRRVTPESVPMPSSTVPLEAHRSLGRPRFDALIDDTVSRLTTEIGRCASLEQAALLVQRAIAIATTDPNSVPSTKTIKRRLPRARALGQKSGQKSGQKATRAKITPQRRK